MTKPGEVLLLGGGGLQARALIEAAARAGELTGWVAADREWRSERRQTVERLGAQIETVDLIEEPERLRALVGAARLVVNCAGPFYRTGSAALDACIECGTDYLDICDDADATLELLERDEAARERGVRALIGMGSSPGVTNVLVRAAVDALGGAEVVDICWIVDVEDVGDAAIQHFWHIFSLVDEKGRRQPVASWEQLSTREVEFSEPIGRATLLELSHPEPLTLPRFLPVEQVRNFGGITPEDSLFVSWAIARMGGSGSGSISLGPTEHQITDLAVALYSAFRERREPTPYLGGGLVVDVRKGNTGFRFSSADSTSMEESTGIPAAAGALLMLNGGGPGPGASAPECLDPSAFFPVLGSVSRNTGSLSLHRLESGREGERMRIRDLLAEGAAR